MKKDDDHDEKRIKCLLMGHRYKLIIRKDLQGGFFYECARCRKTKE